MDLKVKIGKTVFRNPVITASGTFGYGEEYSSFINFDRIGGFCTKGISIEPISGNKGNRIIETSSGMLNSIGLENCGSKKFVEEVLPRIEKFDTKIIVNYYAKSESEFVELTKFLGAINRIDCLEMNLSCPNVKAGGMAFGADPKMIKRLTGAVRKVTDKTLIIKLSPNVTDVTENCRAAEEGGADAISLINTLIGTAIDIESRKFILGNKIGGLSGPAIKPVALRMVWQAVNTVSIPVIGMGGISSVEDALEFLIAGAKAVQIGSYNFINPSFSEECALGIERYLKSRGESLEELIGSLKSDV